MTTCQFSVEILSERFQINIGSIDVLEESLACTFGKLSRCDGNGFNIMLVTGFGRIHGILEKYNGIIVSKCHTSGACSTRYLSNSFR